MSYAEAYASDECVFPTSHVYEPLSDRNIVYEASERKSQSKARNPSDIKIFVQYKPISRARYNSLPIQSRIDVLFKDYTSLRFTEDPPSEYAWRSAENFLHRIDGLTSILAAITPTLSVSDENSLDVYWEYRGNRLVINFPNNNETLPSFAGRTLKGGKISGYISDDFHLQSLTSWLIGK